MFKIEDLLTATGGRLCAKAGAPCRPAGRHAQIKGISIDSRKIKKGYAFIAIPGENFDGHDFIRQAIDKGASCIIKQKGKRAPAPASKVVFIEVGDTVGALGDIARFWRRRFDIPLIAVTGSNGKTTTKDMISWVLSGRFRTLRNKGTKNNQIGLPLTLLNLKQDTDIAVCEIGTNHFGEIRNLCHICEPNIGIITNIGPAHLEHFKKQQGVLKEKYSLIENLKKPYLGILNSDDALLAPRASGIRRAPFILTVGLNSAADFRASDLKIGANRIDFSVNKKYKFTLNTCGHYNVYNALCAVAIARVFGMGYAQISERLSRFEFPKGRLILRQVNGISFLDDTYNANPASFVQAIEALANLKVKGRKIIVMGDMRELGCSKERFHFQAGKLAASACDLFIGIGRLSRIAARAAHLAGLEKRNIFTCMSCCRAKDILFDLVSPTPEDVILVKGSRLMKMEGIFSTDAI